MEFSQTQRAITMGEGTLPWPLIRQELKRLAPSQFIMIDYMLNELEDRSPLLSDRDQVREFLIMVLSSLSPGFPHHRAAPSLLN